MSAAIADIAKQDANATTLKYDDMRTMSFSLEDHGAREHSTFISLQVATIRSTIIDVGGLGALLCADETINCVRLSPKLTA